MLSSKTLKNNKMLRGFLKGVSPEAELGSHMEMDKGGEDTSGQDRNEAWSQQTGCLLERP